MRNMYLGAGGVLELSRLIDYILFEIRHILAALYTQLFLSAHTNRSFSSTAVYPVCVLILHPRDIKRTVCGHGL